MRYLWIIVLILCIGETRENFYFDLPEIEIVSTPVFSEECMIDFITNWDSYRECSYPDFKQDTNGYGTIALFAGECIDTQEAMFRTVSYCNKKFDFVGQRYPDLDLSQKRVITAVFYNLGSANRSSELHKAILTKNKNNLINILLEYNKAGGTCRDHLDKRRWAETELIIKYF